MSEVTEKAWVSRRKAVLGAVSRAFEVSVDDLKSHRRDTRIVRARWAAMYALKEITRLSLPEIGRTLNRDHTTVLYGIRQVEARLEHDLEFRVQVEAVAENARQRIAGQRVEPKLVTLATFAPEIVKRPPPVKSEPPRAILKNRDHMDDPESVAMRKMTARAMQVAIENARALRGQA